jgi:plectin
MDKTKPSITSHLENFLQTARDLEQSLATEKERSRKIAQEYLRTRAQLENGIKELKTRLIQKDSQIATLNESLSVLRLSEDGIRKELATLSENERKLASEITRYKLAWNEAKARESQAKKTAEELDETRRALEEQRNKTLETELLLNDSRKAAEDTSKELLAKRNELSAAVEKLRSAARIQSELQAKITALSEEQKAVEARMLRMDSDLRREMEWELASERSKLRLEMEKEIANDRRHVRETAKKQIKIEIERINSEKSSELDKMKARIDEVTELRNRETERNRSKLLDLSDENQQLLDQLDKAAASKSAESEALRNEIAILRLENNQHQLRIESMKRDSNKATVIEHLKLNAQASEFRSKIDAILKNGFYVQKADHCPDGATIFDSEIEPTYARKTSEPLKEHSIN